MPRIKRPGDFICRPTRCSRYGMAHYLWKYVAAAAPWPYLIGADSRDGYLARTLPEYPSFRYINREHATDMRKFIFSLSAGERIIASETISTMAVNFPDFFWPRFVTRKTSHRSNSRSGENRSPISWYARIS